MGKGDIFKPGKVWCLAVTRGLVGRASHKFTLSYHLIATVAQPRLSREPGGRQKFGPREIALELSITKLWNKNIRRCASASSSLKNKISDDHTRRDYDCVRIIFIYYVLYSMRILTRTSIRYVLYFMRVY